MPCKSGVHGHLAVLHEIHSALGTPFLSCFLFFFCPVFFFLSCFLFLTYFSPPNALSALNLVAFSMCFKCQGANYLCPGFPASK